MTNISVQNNWVYKLGDCQFEHHCSSLRLKLSNSQSRGCSEVYILLPQFIPTSTRCKLSNPYKFVFSWKGVDWKSVSIYTGSTAKNERDPNKNNKGKIMEGKILMRGKNAQYISEEISMSCFRRKDVKNHWGGTEKLSYHHSL